MTIHQDELLDIVDAQDQIIGTVWRSQRNDADNNYFRAVNAFLKNAEGKICIFRRSKNKSYLPLHWALVGGCVSSGEDYDRAMLREIAEEITITMQPNQMCPLGLIKPYEYNSRFFKKLYEIVIDTSEIKYNPDDFCEYQWILPHELFELEKNGELIEKAVLYFVQRFYM